MTRSTQFGKTALQFRAIRRVGQIQLSIVQSDWSWQAGKHAQRDTLTQVLQERAAATSKPVGNTA